MEGLKIVRRLVLKKTKQKKSPKMLNSENKLVDVGKFGGCRLLSLWGKKEKRQEKSAMGED